MSNPTQNINTAIDEDEAFMYFKEGIRIIAKLIIKAIIQEAQLCSVEISENAKSLKSSFESPTETKKITYSVVEAADLLGLSRSAAYEAVRRNQIPNIKFGRRIVIPRFALEKMLLEVSH
jgi:excisionase family DNA binding protein